jgi:hypothetical protein
LWKRESDRESDPPVAASSSWAASEDAMLFGWRLFAELAQPAEPRRA